MVSPEKFKKNSRKIHLYACTKPNKKGLALTRAQTAVHFLLQPRPKTIFYPKLNNISVCREIQLM